MVLFSLADFTKINKPPLIIVLLDGSFSYLIIGNRREQINDKGPLESEAVLYTLADFTKDK